MKKYMKIILIVIGMIASFILGLELNLLLGGKPAPDGDAAEIAVIEPNAETPLSLVQAPEIRVFDGMVEWFDGARWHVLGDVDTWIAADPIAVAIALAEMQEIGIGSEGAEEETPDSVAGANRGSASPYSGGGGGGGGGGGSSGDGEDISWSDDYL